MFLEIFKKKYEPYIDPLVWNFLNLQMKSLKFWNKISKTQNIIYNQNKQRLLDCQFMVFKAKILQLYFWNIYNTWNIVFNLAYCACESKTFY